jgi:hypothetical protein
MVKLWSSSMTICQQDKRKGVPSAKLEQAFFTCDAEQESGLHHKLDVKIAAQNY